MRKDYKSEQMVKNRYQEPLGKQSIRCYLVYGRKNASKTDENPKVIVSRVYARNAAFAESKFWKINRSLFKIKKSNGRVLKVQEVGEKSVNKIKNFGIFYKYRSHVGTHNSYKEVRATSLSAAMQILYAELGSNHKVDNTRIKIIKTSELKDNQLRVRNPRCVSWLKTDKIAFPIWKKTARASEARYDSTYTTQRPVVYMTGESVDI